MMDNLKVKVKCVKEVRDKKAIEYVNLVSLHDGCAKLFEEKDLVIADK